MNGTDISLKEGLKSGTHSYYQEHILSQKCILDQECVLNHLEIITIPPPTLNLPPLPMREERFRLKEIVFYNLSIYLFNIFEILIIKLIIFLNLQIVNPLY